MIRYCFFVIIIIDKLFHLFYHLIDVFEGSVIIMDFSTDYLKNILKKHLKINSNNETFEMCYYRCANKDKLKVMFQSEDHEIIFGRRGTGKTTLLKSFTYYINEIQNQDIDTPTCFCVYINMEDIVPNANEINATDTNSYKIEIYKKFLTKLYLEFNEHFNIIAETNHYFNINYSEKQLERIMDNLLEFSYIIENGCSSTSNKTYHKVSVVESGKSSVSGFELETSTKINNYNPLNLLASFFRKKKKTETAKSTFTTSEDYSFNLDISKVREAICNIVDSLNVSKLYICIDEFTWVDKGLDKSIQPDIAQMIKDTFFRLPNVMIKITSLWSRNEMQYRNNKSISKVGIELGEDIRRNIDLDTIFSDNNYALTFFENLIINIILLEDNEKNHIQQDYEKSKRDFTTYTLNKLFSGDSFKLLVCASQGIPRVFCDILVSSMKPKENTKSKLITPQVVFESTVNHFRQETRKKIDNSDPLVIEIDEYVTKNKQRIMMIPIKDYENNKTVINILVDKNYIHQFPSETIPRTVRNKYKVFLVHYGNYLESLGIKEYRQMTNEDLSIFPKVSSHMISNPEKYTLSLNNVVK